MHAPPRRLLVASAGLDLLPATRLKVASSLLMADRLEVAVVPWTGAAVDLLMADAASSEGSAAIREAWAARLPVVTFTREAGARSGTAAELSPTASVRQIADTLKTALAAGARQGEPLAPRSLRLVDLLRVEARPLGEPHGRTLMELGLLRVVVDPMATRLHMLRRMPLDELLDAVEDPRWQSTRLSESDWQRLYRPDVTVSHPLEMLWWWLAARERFELPVVSLGELRLAAWPDLDTSITPVSWLPVLAQLRIRAWRPTALASATGIPLPTVRRVMTAAQVSGLGQTVIDGGESGSQPLRRMAEPEARSFLRIARRFGLKLMGLQRD